MPVGRESSRPAAVQNYLLPPPRVLQHGELPPVIQPALYGVPAFDGPTPDHFEPFASKELPPAVSPELLERIRETVLKHKDVKERLDDERFEWIGVSVRDEKAGEGGVEGTLLAVLYSYSANRAIEVRLNRDGQKIHDVAVLAYQPPATAGEIERAIELARSHPELAEQLSNDLVGTAILVSLTDHESPGFDHRGFDVRFGCPSERLPRFMAMVDLSRETVVSVGSCCARALGNAQLNEGGQP